MVDDETVARIAHETRLWHFSTREKILGSIAVFAALVALISISVGISNKYAQSHTASCLNQNLGARNAPNLADKAAQDKLNLAQGDLGKAVIVALSEIPTNPGHVLPDLVTAFQAQQAAQAAFTAQRKVDDASRDKNPIGKC